MATFDADTLSMLHDAREVRIRTERHPATAVVIWIVTDGQEVFVRSVRGAQARWYRDLAAGGEATLEMNVRQVVVRVTPAADTVSIERASRAYLTKYHDSPYALPMVRDEVLPTTLRVEPR
jgi:hypothetical protein